jgi:UDP-2,3-diacylglucosamine hydrolase
MSLMSETLFIADLHLTPSDPRLMERGLTFLSNRARSAESLYILGDLFEVWIGDDDQTSGYQPIIAALQQLTRQGIPVFLMVGNRDFLLGATFCEMTGCQFITDPTIIDLYGIPTLLTHGDQLCTADVAYQTFRQQVRQADWQKQFLALPLAQRRALAQQARAQSQVYTQAMTLDLIPTEAVIAWLKFYGVYRLIHGHIHRPGCHELNLNGQIATRYVVGDWQQEDIVILRSTIEGCQLLSYHALSLSESLLE